ncbi:hypothetical protein [Nocardia sp. alder85J]|uniref:hypothetical protein n=1 Tax=Nocardia sp. alder85J TaxID=2862949 RepID=UPI001CD505B8|nr:hypothetical protein [Nocardia sp. alder85J]MCX4095818.1 hypothetical protein [Nocardia sp. alder85J]
MTIYSTDPTHLLHTAVETLAHRVLPELGDGIARIELAAVLEQLDNMANRVRWDESGLATSYDRTEALATELGLPPREDDHPGVESLRQRRRDIAATLAGTYRNPDLRPADVAAAVARFTTADVDDQISLGLRGGFGGWSE